MLNMSFEMGDDGPILYDAKASNFFEKIDEQIHLVDNEYNEAELKEFFQEVKRFFVYDSGSGESDYPEDYQFFDTEKDIICYLNNSDIYNYEDLFVYDSETEKQMKVSQTFSIEYK